MNFSLIMPSKILFGRGEFGNTRIHAAALGKRFLVVANPPLVQSGHAKELIASLQSAGLQAWLYDGVTGEPTPEMVHEAAGIARAQGCDGLIALGGGSAIDVAKAAAAMAVNAGSVVEYLEGVGAGRKIEHDPLPFIAIPTTSGTGAEATKNAVISDLAKGYKSSFRSDKLLARVAIIDPELTLAVPPAITAWSGMDALTQLMEAYISKKSQPVTDALALSGIPRVAASLLRAYMDGHDIEAREGMAYGSFLSGICLANAGLGAVHGIAAALGAIVGTPHGLACAVLLPHVMAVNMPHTAEKAAPLCQALTGRAWPELSDNVKAVTCYINELAGQLGIPASFHAADHSDEKIARITAAVSRSSMSGNPVALSDEQTAELIRKAL